MDGLIKELEKPCLTPSIVVSQSPCPYAVLMYIMFGGSFQTLVVQNASTEVLSVFLDHRTEFPDGMLLDYCRILPTTTASSYNENILVLLGN